VEFESGVNAFQFWMGGKHATNLIEVSEDPSVLEDGEFWAVSTSFEGKNTFSRFKDVTEKEFVAPAWAKVSGSWSSSLSKESYEAYVESIRSEIENGSVYQVNACRRLSINGIHQSLAGLFADLQKNNPSPFAAYLSLPDLEIASASPELFLQRHGHDLKTSPIKGTQSLDHVIFGQKDQSENIMIVDLMRNDLGRICEPGSVEVSELLRSEEHPGLRHLVSDVVGKLSSNVNWKQILNELSPAGSVSGAPKLSALKCISRNEPVARGSYCGLLGWVQGDQAMLSVAIRTFWKAGDGVLNFGTGAGITWASDASSEWEETQLKARKLISIAGGELS
jgi:para-aminobenzoate synthetase component 1